VNCIDLYSGIGGWTLGMHLAGIEPIASYEWNVDSNETHNRNFGTRTKETDIRTLELSDLPKPGSIDIVVGSPPCTQFSFSNRGGSGNMEDGLVDIFKFLSVVEYLRPKFWAMENVPRVSGILEKLLVEHPAFRRFKSMVAVNCVVDCSDYGTPQRRKRMICGDFPLHSLLALRGKFTPTTLGDIVSSLKDGVRIDPLYGWSVNEVTDHVLEEPLNQEELRLNREAKRCHPIYNKMPFPEPMDRPSRTVTSLCTRVSRESMVILDRGAYRRLTLRERAMCMGFPVSFSFYGRNYSSKLQMIGNAIPPPLTFCIFSAMKGEAPSSLAGNEGYVHSLPEQPPPVTLPPFPKNKFPSTRSFRLCIPHLRFGSGVRFELSNQAQKWTVRFFFGSSKSISEVVLDEGLGEAAAALLGIKFPLCMPAPMNVSSESLQSGWTAKSDVSAFDVLDALGALSLGLLEKHTNTDFRSLDLSSLLGRPVNRSLNVDPVRVLVGIVVGSSFNSRSAIQMAEKCEATCDAQGLRTTIGAGQFVATRA
jgi:DNA (cytosine-5)-methyltransferase 1